MVRDIINLRHTNNANNITKITKETLDHGELALIREFGYERLYCKNSMDEIVPIHQVIDCGMIPLNTIQDKWINNEIAYWNGDIIAQNQVKFVKTIPLFFTPPKVEDFNRLTSMESTFMDCINVKNLYLTDWDMSNITNTRNMFRNCHNLTLITVNKWPTNVTNMNAMFASCPMLETLDLSSFNTSNVTDMSELFYKCNGLLSLNLSNFNTSNVYDMNNMFSECSNLTSLDLSKFMTSNVINMSYMFYGCYGLKTLDLSNFDTYNITTMSFMFMNCVGLTSLNLSNWKLDNLYMQWLFPLGGMFSNCYLLNELNINGWDLSMHSYEKIFNSATFNACNSLATIKMLGCNQTTIDYIKRSLTEANIISNVTIITS